MSSQENDVAAINELDIEEEKEKKMDQLKAAIEAANDKLAKLYKRWLSAHPSASYCFQTQSMAPLCFE